MVEKRGKKGQVQMSFGMIFSIIIIIASAGVAFYAITYFLELSRCTQVGNFYSSVENEIDKAWAGTISEKIFIGKLPSGIKAVCFGNLSQNYGQEFSSIREELEWIAVPGSNIFLYPTKEACKGEFATKKLEHVIIDEFFCVSVKENKMSVRLIKKSGEALVRLSKP